VGHVAHGLQQCLSVGFQHVWRILRNHAHVVRVFAFYL
jgi:hypothetical protein